ncbi:hypothetical protein RFI_00037 [Reticulomyxa filosa]|uniref:CCHC-type domain-containing protein n=1 Tax=Reticulomyxa filosa TaxID=46433 RepID=X6PG70_RETFI|nr:hypothetical protein RFI_00037 [Reticulomyxa filosa]|eukprot:ETO37024.1 hypothetical protein RFI_00037 [Reticulomyxa filosa]
MSPKVLMQRLIDVGEHIKENEPIVSSRLRLSVKCKRLSFSAGTKDIHDILSMDDKEQAHDKSFMLGKCDDDAKEHLVRESVCKDSTDENSLKKQIHTLQEQITLLSQRLQLQESKSSVSQMYQGDNGNINPKLVVNSTCAAILSERPHVVTSSNNDNTHDLRDSTDDLKATYHLSDKFCMRYMLSQCLSFDVQDMVAAEQPQTFAELMAWLCTMFGGKHHVIERTDDLLHFRTKSGEGPADILLRWRKAKCTLKLELDYAAECKVPARKRLQPSDERFDDEIQSRQITYRRQKWGHKYINDTYKESYDNINLHVQSNAGEKQVTEDKQQSNGLKYPKRHWNDECWNCGEHGHQQGECPNHRNELHVIERQSDQEVGSIYFQYLLLTN